MRIIRLLLCLAFFSLPSLIALAQQQQLDSRKVYEVASPGVVLIKNGDSENGSGFLVNPSGIILTNYHVIEDADSLGAIIIKFKDNTIFPCRRILYKDPKKDIAILKIDATGRRPVLPIAPDGIVQQGEDVAAIGCPFGIEFTITKGIISNLMPSVATPYLLQFDASINPGNSGGPILNRFAQVTGMVVSRFEGGGRAQNINFAIKTESLRSALDANHIQYLDSGLIKEVDSLSLRLRAAQDSLLNTLEQNKIAMQRAQDSINRINEAQKIAQQRSQDSLRDAVEAERQRNLDFQLSVQREQEAQRRLKEMERIRLAGIRDSIERLSTPRRHTGQYRAPVHHRSLDTQAQLLLWFRYRDNAIKAHRRREFWSGAGDVRLSAECARGGISWNILRRLWDNRYGFGRGNDSISPAGAPARLRIRQSP